MKKRRKKAETGIIKIGGGDVGVERIGRTAAGRSRVVLLMDAGSIKKGTELLVSPGEFIRTTLLPIKWQPAPQQPVEVPVQIRTWPHGLLPPNDIPTPRQILDGLLTGQRSRHVTPTVLATRERAIRAIQDGELAGRRPTAVEFQAMLVLRALEAFDRNITANARIRDAFEADLWERMAQSAQVYAIWCEA